MCRLSWRARASSACLVRRTCTCGDVENRVFARSATTSHHAPRCSPQFRQCRVQRGDSPAGRGSGWRCRARLTVFTSRRGSSQREDACSRLGSPLDSCPLVDESPRSALKLELLVADPTPIVRTSDVPRTLVAFAAVARRTRGPCVCLLPCTRTACHLPASCWHSKELQFACVLFNASC